MKHINTKLFIKGIENANLKEYFYALADDRVGTNIFIKSDNFKEPFVIYDDEISINGYEGNCEKLINGKANYLLLIENSEEMDVIFYSLLDNEKDISDNTESFTVGNIRIGFEE